MKRTLLLIAAVLLSTIMLNAKTVKGKVEDQNGIPVSGMKVAIIREDAPENRIITKTDTTGCFEIDVPEDFDVNILRSVFTRRFDKVLKFQERGGELRIVIKRD